MHQILLVQGANLKYLGMREPEVYGTTTADQLNLMLLKHADKIGVHLDIFYTNHEGDAIERIYQAKEDRIDGIVMNPAGFTYAGYALRDCILGVGLPYVEIHISNIAQRKIHSVLSDVSEGVITGFGVGGYLLALDAINNILTAKKHAAVY